MVFREHWAVVWRRPALSEVVPSGEDQEGGNGSQIFEESAAGAHLLHRPAPQIFGQIADAPISQRRYSTADRLAREGYRGQEVTPVPAATDVRCHQRQGPGWACLWTLIPAPTRLRPGSGRQTIKLLTV